MIAAALLACLAAPAAREDPLDVVLVVIDDVGLEFLELYDRENLLPAGIAARVPHVYPRTPTLARLAAGGVRFTQARVNPTCATTRATLLTGRYAFRHGVGGLVRPRDATPHNARAETIELGVGPGNREWTLAHVARAAGAASFFCGKYHLALQPDQLALGGEPGAGWNHIRAVAGFDDYWSVWANLPGRPPPETWTDAEGRELRPGYFNFVACANGRVDNLRGDYLTSVQVDRAIEYVDARESQPFLLVLSFNAVHEPYQLPPAELVTTEWYVEHAREQEGRGRSTWAFYCAMLEALDRELGRFVDHLEERGRRAVFFVLADNGTQGAVVRHALERDGLDLGPVAPRMFRADRHRFKHTVWEPGVRVPLIVSGPIVASPGRSCDALVDAPDVFATVRELWDVPLDEVVTDQRRFDGVSLLPVLRDPAATHARTFSLVERFEPGGNPEHIALREGEMAQEYQRRIGFVLQTEAGRFKLVRNLDDSEQQGDRLFALSDAGGDPVDPWELKAIPRRGEANRARYRELRAALEELLRSEGDNWDD
jgi:arylsulfatase A-like enzyme